MSLRKSCWVTPISVRWKKEREALRRYLVEKGGLLFVDTLPHRMWSKDVPVSRWSFRMKAELREILPESRIVPMLL
ncbi:TPA: hypothetical protein EYP66_24080 [Candidatus Poribacteria bacterium]|nr:hypothetical protein [Candidatus Poribacteria bacterium]